MSSRRRWRYAPGEHQAPEGLIAGAAAALAVSLRLYFPDRDDGSGAILGGLSALIAVPLGVAAVAKDRSLPERGLWPQALI